MALSVWLSTNSEDISMKEHYKKGHMRRCGVCGITLPQQEMIRDDCSDSGWICPDCDSELHPDFDADDF